MQFNEQVYVFVYVKKKFNVFLHLKLSIFTLRYIMHLSMLSPRVEGVRSS